MKTIKLALLSLILLIICCGCSNSGWPLNENTNYVPEPTFGRLDSLSNSFGATRAVYHNVSKEQSSKYLSLLQEHNFIYDVKKKDFLGFSYFTAKNNKTKIKIKYYRLPTESVIIVLDKKDK